MSRIQRSIACLVALMLTLSMGSVALAEDSYPVQWDLTQIYADVDAWQKDYDTVMSMLPQYEQYRGTLNTAQGLYDYLQFSYMGELTRLQNRISLYAYLGANLNPSDPVFKTLQARLSVMKSKESQYGAFVSAEIFALPLETRQEMLSDPLLANLAYALREYVDPEREPLSEETETVLAILSPSLGRANSIFDIMDSVDLPYPTITMPDGTQAELTNELYNQIVYSDDYDRDFKALCNQTILTRSVSFANTFAALLEENAAQNWAYAQIDHYDSSREAALAGSDVKPEIYDMLIEAARAGAPDYQRYLNAHKRGLNLDVQYPFDTATYVSDYSVTDISYEDAVNEVRKALAVLGDDYLAIYDDLIANGYLDVYPSDTKVTGAFSVNMGDEFLPYMLFNYVGIPSDVSTLAHEMGHSIYSVYSMQEQDQMYAYPTIFTQEVASTTNELLYYSYMMNNASTEDEKLFYLEDMLSMFGGTFFIQVLFSEFEDSLYKTVEAGESLDAETLSDMWEELYQTYRGDTVMTYPDGRYNWTTIPHFYYNYYVYQYATSISYAASICEGIMNGEENAVENYKAFLKLGNSMSPAELLTVAGIDPMEKETYQKALDFFGNLVDEYEKLVDARSTVQ